MKEPDWAHCSENELWHYVATHLAMQGIDTVLVGGGAAAAHSKGAYQSGDLDLLIDSYPPPSTGQLDRAMAEIGFFRESRHYRHPQCTHLFVEFIWSSLHLGKDYRIEPQTWKVDSTSIRRLSATDSIKDRLASYVYFKARECLDQAVLVANANCIHWDSVRDWAAKEGEEMSQAAEEVRRLANGPE